LDVVFNVDEAGGVEHLVGLLGVVEQHDRVREPLEQFVVRVVGADD
jgi:hypothetical protein